MPEEQPNEKKELEQAQDEIVSVNPNEQTLSVEEEMKANTPVEEGVEKPEEETKEKEPEQEKQESEADTKKPEMPSEEIETKEKEETEEKTDDNPPQEEEQKPEEEEPKEEQEKKEEPSVEDEIAKRQEEFDRMKAELEEMKAAEETRKLIKDREDKIKEASRTYEEFAGNLQNAILDTFKKYGIDPEIDIEELKKDPSKYQVAKDIVMNAQRILAEKQQELIKPVTEASNAIVFREAGRMMAKFDMSEEQTKVCAETLINILDNTGLVDLDEDLKAKVELAVARAKMIVPKVKEVAEGVKEVVKDTKEAVKDVIAEKADKQEEPAKEPEQEQPKQPTVVEEKPSLEGFKESATVVDSNPSAANVITVDNVLKVLASLPFRERTAFLLEHNDLIDEAMRKRSR